MTKYLLFMLMLGFSICAHAQNILYWQDSNGDNSLDAGDWTSTDWNTDRSGGGTATAPANGDTLRFHQKTVTINSWPVTDIVVQLRRETDMTVATDMTVNKFQITQNIAPMRSLTVNAGVTLAVTTNFTCSSGAVIDINIDGTIQTDNHYLNHSNGNGGGANTIIAGGGTLDVGNNMRIHGTLTNSGDVMVAADIEESTGMITNNSGGTITVTTNIQNFAGTFVNSGTINANHFDVNAGGSLTNNSGATVTLGGAMRDISGSVNNAGSISIGNRVVVNGSFTNSNELSVGGDLRIDAGTFTNTASGNVEVANCNDITVALGATYTNDGNTGTTMGGTECHAAVPCEGDCDGLNSILPVELLSFTGTAKEFSNLLQWATAAEENTMEHRIERSLDGRSWEKIGSVPGAGYSSTTVYYTFEDAEPAASTYYRLRFVDYDGYEEFSPVIAINRQSDGDETIRLSPNPFSDFLRLDWQAPKAGTYQWTILDLQGRTVATQAVTVEEGNRSELLPVNQLPSGTYLLRITNEQGEQLYMDRLIKQ